MEWAQNDGSGTDKLHFKNIDGCQQALAETPEGIKSLSRRH